MQMLAELGQLHLEQRNVRDATTAWNDAVDVIFSTVRACKCWRGLVLKDPLAMLQKYGAWRLLVAVLVLSKLGRFCADAAQVRPAAALVHASAAGTTPQRSTPFRFPRPLLLSERCPNGATAPGSPYATPPCGPRHNGGMK